MDTSLSSLVTTSAAKRKLQRVRNSVNNLEEEMADVYLTPKEYFGNESCKIYNEFINKEKDFSRLIELIKYKILTSVLKIQFNYLP